MLESADKSQGSSEQLIIENAEQHQIEQYVASVLEVIDSASAEILSTAISDLNLLIKHLRNHDMGLQLVSSSGKMHKNFIEKIWAPSVLNEQTLIDCEPLAQISETKREKIRSARRHGLVSYHFTPAMSSGRDRLPDTPRLLTADLLRHEEDIEVQLVERRHRWSV